MNTPGVPDPPAYASGGIMGPAWTSPQIDTSTMGERPSRPDPREHMEHYTAWDGDVVLCTACGTLLVQEYRPQHDRLHDRLDRMGTVMCRSCLGCGRVADGGRVVDCGACHGDGWL